ncbi:ABC transporter permease [Bacillus sp. REN16]|uniref:ABC transporter permease n=1 Tax=Bacillus sp. REN16 TaxID=2887296 RepID=UPI001E5AA528|nr:ABC transporter permease [Bacillus sp. REN16]MCC3358102.1 ABC transporter permease [Bacillus sp. REN16]
MTFPQFVFKNVVRNKRTYAAYFFSSAFSVLIFFVYALFIFHPDIKEGVTAGLAVQMMIAAEFIMYVFSFLFVLYSVSTFLKTRKKEFGILMMHGMTRHQLNVMVFLENMLIGIGAIIVGIGLGLITGKLFLMVGANMIGIEQLPFYFSGKALALTICAFLVLFFIISLFTTFLVRSNKLIDLFQAGQKPKKEPKVSILLSILSAILLIVSYCLAATATPYTLIFLMLPVIAMTIVGTYFFYTQLSVFFVKLLIKNRIFFWKKTNLLTVSNLAYRIKDNARMFFMVTIVSTVAFCAVGTLASTKVFTEQTQMEYPAEVSYLAKNEDPVHKQNLGQIKNELKERGLTYTSNEVPIKVVKVAKAISKYPYPAEQLEVISFSNYQAISESAGYDFKEKSLVGNETLSLRQSTIENLSEDRYVLEQDGIEVKPMELSEHVVFPFQLVQDTGIIVSDELYEKLKPERVEIYTGFYTDEIGKTNGLIGNLAEEGFAFATEEDPFAIVVRGTIHEKTVSMYQMMFFVALLIGAVFFLAAGSFLYFRLYADLEYDARQYLTIQKVGLTDGELSQIVTRQLALLFFVPIIVAFVHSGFAFMALQSFFQVSIATEVIQVLIVFLIAQVIYFVLIRQRYLRNLKKSMI